MFVTHERQHPSHSSTNLVIFVLLGVSLLLLSLSSLMRKTNVHKKQLPVALSMLHETEPVDIGVQVWTTVMPQVRQCSGSLDS